MLVSGDWPVDLTDRAGTGNSVGFYDLCRCFAKRIEAELILRTLASVGGNKARGRILGIERRSIYNLLERHGRHTAAGGRRPQW